MDTGNQFGLLIYINNYKNDMDYLEKALSQGIIKIEEIYYLYLLPTSGSPTYLYPALVTKLTSLPGTRSLSAGCRWRSSSNIVSSVQWLLCGN